jgi:hypothetical protein
VAERVKSRSRLKTRGSQMNSQESYQNFYDPKTLAVMDRAFAAIWTAMKG